MSKYEVEAKEFASELMKLYAKHLAAKTPTTRDKYFKKCLELCEVKQAELRVNYSEITIIKTITPIYRKAIAMASGMMDEKKKGGYKYTNYPVAFWRVDRAENEKIFHQTKVNVSAKKQNATRVTVECREALLNLADEILNAPFIDTPTAVFKKALAIALVTGRRFYVEVLRQANFTKLDEIEDYNRVMTFTGQAKGGLEKTKQVYKLPCFSDVDLVIENLAFVQGYVKAKPWYLDEMDSKTFSSKLKKQCEYALISFQAICKQHGFLITIKDLRSLYMAFCYYDYSVLSARMPDYDNYVGSIAGHDVNALNGKGYYNATTTEHYKNFIDARWDDKLS